MKLTSLSGLPIVGRRNGQVFGAPGATNVARSRVVPLQPKTNPQTDPTNIVAALAQLWKLITPADKLTWGNPGLPTEVLYANYVAFSVPLAQWGLPLWQSYPGPILNAGLAVASLYAEPDGIHTSLGLFLTGAPTPPTECYVELYIQPYGSPLAKSGAKVQYTYAGGFGPLSGGGYNWFDFTAQWAKLAGQWWYPGSADTTARTLCGTDVNAKYYVRDQYGRLSTGDGPYPASYLSIGTNPPQVGPGVCPHLPGPPYPWAPSH